MSLKEPAKRAENGRLKHSQAVQHVICPLAVRGPASHGRQGRQEGPLVCSRQARQRGSMHIHMDSRARRSMLQRETHQLRQAT